jgi:putative cardiolipin synthase
VKKSAAVLVLAAALLGSGCATLPPNTGRTVTHAFRDTGSTKLGRAATRKASAHPGKSGLFLLSSGLDAYVARVALAEAAERSIDVQYYLYHNDETGRFFTRQLLRAADRGVRVRLLVDDMDLGGRDLGIAAMDGHPHVEVRIFNPFSREAARASQFVTRFGSVTRRMHNKSFTVDNQVTIVGGRNIGDEYFETHPKFNFSDLDLLAVGPVVEEVSASFDAYWNSELAYPAGTLLDASPSAAQVAELRRTLEEYAAKMQESVYADALRGSDLAVALREGSVNYRWGMAGALYDNPEKLVADPEEEELRLAAQLRPRFEEVQSELLIISPYFVPGRAGVKFLCGLAERGVAVRILTNSLASTDVGIVHAGYAKRRPALLRCGVGLYELNAALARPEAAGRAKGSASSLHAKTFVLDRSTLFVGTLNLDPRAVVYNTEIGIVAREPGMAEEIARWFDEHLDEIAFRVERYRDLRGDERLRWVRTEGGSEKAFDNEPHAGFWRSFAIGLLGLLPIDSQL